MAACGSAASAGGRPSAGLSPRQRASYRFVNSDPVAYLVGAPNAAAVWFFNVTKSADVVYRLSADGKLRSWPVLRGKRRIVAGIDIGLAVARDGIVWLGVGDTLVRLTPGSGKVRTWTVPAGRLNPLETRMLPPAVRMRRGHPRPSISGLAVSPRGQVAIAFFLLRSSVTTFDPATGRFSIVELPSADDLETAIAYGSHGALAVGFADIGHGGAVDHVLLIDGHHRKVVHVAHTAAGALARHGPAAFVAGQLDPQLVTVRGTVRPLRAPNSLTATDNLDQSLQALSRHRLVGLTRSGVVVFPANSMSSRKTATRARTYRTARERCPTGPLGSTSPPRHRPARVRVCHQPVYSYATDGHGDIWILTDPNSDTVELLTHPR